MFALKNSHVVFAAEVRDRILSHAPNTTNGSTSGALDYKVLPDLEQGTLSAPHAGAVCKGMLLGQRIYRREGREKKLGPFGFETCKKSAVYHILIVTDGTAFKHIIFTKPRLNMLYTLGKTHEYEQYN